MVFRRCRRFDAGRALLVEVVGLAGMFCEAAAGMKTLGRLLEATDVATCGV